MYLVCAGVEKKNRSKPNYSFVSILSPITITSFLLWFIFFPQRRIFRELCCFAHNIPLYFFSIFFNIFFIAGFLIPYNHDEPRRKLAGSCHDFCSPEKLLNRWKREKNTKHGSSCYPSWPSKNFVVAAFNAKKLCIDRGKYRK